jgi:hypothetical protein
MEDSFAMSRENFGLGTVAPAGRRAQDGEMFIFRQQSGNCTRWHLPSRFW